MDRAAGWDEAVQVIQKRHQRKNSPRPQQGHKRPIYGMPGQHA